MLVRCYRQRVSDFDVKTQLRNQQELRTVILRSHHISSLRTPAEQSFDAWKWWHIAGDGEQESKMHNTSVSVTTMVSSTARYGIRTYPRKTNSTITTFGLCGEFFEMVVDEFATWSLDHTTAVRDGVVGLAFTKDYSLCHC